MSDAKRPRGCERMAQSEATGDWTHRERYGYLGWVRFWSLRTRTHQAALKRCLLPKLIYIR